MPPPRRPVPLPQATSISPRETPTGVSPFKVHCEKYADGCGAAICHGAHKRVFARGRLPCDALFIGEAPGESENVLGQPFVGPAGMLLDKIIDRALKGRSIRIAFTNLVCCIPRELDPERGRVGKAAEPEVDDVEACAPRLQEMVDLAQPRLVVCVGAMARDWLSRGHKNPVKIPKDVKMVDVTHPAALLRMNVAQKGFMIQRAVVNISSAFDSMFATEPPQAGGG